jgi:molybdopterin molybdotransferase
MANNDPDSILHPGLVPAEKALEIVLEGAGPGGTENVPVAEAAFRVLADDLASLRTQPPFDASAMDGYAVRHSDIAQLPARLEIIGQSAAGHPFSSVVSSGQAVRIFTGAPVPDGADTVVIQENTEAEGDIVTIISETAPGKNIRKAGLDFREGDILIRKGSQLVPHTLALAASMNHASLTVFRRPKVFVVTTGDELVLPGNALRPGQIIASNSLALMALAREAGADAMDLGIAPDTREALSRIIDKAIAAGADLIVTSGGASVGDHDLVKPVLDELGFTFSFVKVAMRPGKPVIFAWRETGGKRVRILGLPGNPVSSLVASNLFVRPLVRVLGGHPADAARPVPAVLGAPMPANDQRQDHVRATARRLDNGTLEVSPFGVQDSSMLATLQKSDCLIVRPPLAPQAQAGDAVSVILLRQI